MLQKHPSASEGPSLEIGDSTKNKPGRPLEVGGFSTESTDGLQLFLEGYWNLSSSGEDKWQKQCFMVL